MLVGAGELVVPDETLIGALIKHEVVRRVTQVRTPIFRCHIMRTSDPYCCKVFASADQCHLGFWADNGRRGSSLARLCIGHPLSMSSCHARNDGPEAVLMRQRQLLRC